MRLGTRQIVMRPSQQLFLETRCLPKQASETGRRGLGSAEDTTLEKPLILVTLTDRAQGILRGKSEIRPFFEAGLRKLGKEVNR